MSNEREYRIVNEKWKEKVMNLSGKPIHHGKFEATKTCVVYTNQFEYISIFVWQRNLNVKRLGYGW